MASDVPPTTSPPSGQLPKWGSALPDARPLFEGLERFRESLQQRIDRIEALVVERARTSPGEISTRERELLRRVAELEERHRLLGAEARRREQEHEAAMAQLEEDRQMLAEAWERLEQERIHGGPATAAPPSAAAPAPAKPAYRPAVASGDDDAVAQAILRQFQTLRSDVRRNANGRRPRR
jgi:hypothetical protein